MNGILRGEVHEELLGLPITGRWSACSASRWTGAPTSRPWCSPRTARPCRDSRGGPRLPPGGDRAVVARVDRGGAPTRVVRSAAGSGRAERRRRPRCGRRRCRPAGRRPRRHRRQRRRRRRRSADHRRARAGGCELRWLDDRCLAPGYVWGLATAGTNALGLAIEHRSPTLLIGDEHFADRLLDLSMSAAPIRDPHSGAVAGALALACPAAGSSSLLLHVARRSAQDVEAQVDEDRRPEPRRSPSSDEFRRRGRSDASLGWDSLTECEWRLAELVADGLTNRQAAARLSVSHHTVDSHLRHIFRKLDINSRVGLARVMSSRVARWMRSPDRSPGRPTRRPPPPGSHRHAVAIPAPARRGGRRCARVVGERAGRGRAGS